MNVHMMQVSPEFFPTLEMPIVLGRGLHRSRYPERAEGRDHQRDRGHQYFPGENPIGKRVGFSPGTTSEFEIVGVVRDARYDERARRAAADAVPGRDSGADATDDRGRPHRRRSGAADRARARGRPAPRCEPADDERRDADRAGRASVHAGRLFASAVVLRRPRAAARGDRSVRTDVLQRRTPQPGDRHPHGARRPGGST